MLGAIDAVLRLVLHVATNRGGRDKSGPYFRPMNWVDELVLVYDK